MIDCITLESRRGALNDICHPPMRADQWHQLTLLVTELLRVVDELYDELDDSHWSHDNCVLPSTEIKQDGMLMVEVVVQLTSIITDCSTL